MAAFEMAHTYDLDSVVTYLLQILYLLHDSRPRVAHFIYPLLGKVINIALMMGLSTDPDEFPGKYSLFEAEQRRRVWWDIYYYDV
jgi:Fungal specific transcription factor domain